MNNLAVIIPFFNEEVYLEESVNRVLNCDIFDQIILVDDCSTDNSPEIAKDICSINNNVMYLKTPKNGGKGSAIIIAKPALKTTHVVIHDADLEYFPSDIVEMYKVSKDYPESLILGTRFKGNKIRKNVYLRTGLANRMMSLFFSLVNFYKVSDVATCYKLMPTEFFRSIRLNEQGFSIEIEILSKFLKTKNKIKEVPIKYEGRTYSEGKKIKTSDGFKYLFNTLKYRFFN